MGFNGPEVNDSRTNESMTIDLNTDDITKNIVKRISEQVNISSKNAENFQFIYYSKDKEYKPHFDSWDFDCSLPRHYKSSGPRITSALIYLNDVIQGGETYMTELDIYIKPKKGRLLIFNNTMLNAENNIIINPLSEHIGMPVIEGEKSYHNLV